MVMYDNEEEIGIHLYHKPMVKLNDVLNLDGYSKTDYKSPF